jgi:hypothetical protein
MFFSKHKEALNEEQTKSRFEFTLPDIVPPSMDDPGPFRFDPVVSTRIVSSLRARGFQVTDPSEGKPELTEVFEINFPEFNLMACLVPGQGKEYWMWTRPLSRFLSRKVPPEVVSEKWTAACREIEDILRADLKATFLRVLSPAAKRKNDRIHDWSQPSPCNGSASDEPEKSALPPEDLAPHN